MAVREVVKSTIVLSQDGNTMGTTGEYETLEIALEYQAPEPGQGQDCFVVLKTEGWSIDDTEDLTDFIQNYKRMVGALSLGKSLPSS